MINPNPDVEANINIQSNNNIIMFQEAKCCNSRCLYCTANCVIQCTILGIIMFIMFTILVFIVMSII